MKCDAIKNTAVIGICLALCSCHKNETLNEHNQNVAQEQNHQTVLPKHAATEPAETIPKPADADVVADGNDDADGRNMGSILGAKAQNDAINGEHKSILCEDDYCKCGNIGCGRGSYCNSGVCVCGKERAEFPTDLYQCIDGKYRCIGTGGFDSCDCGAVSCSIGSDCVGGNSCTCAGREQTPEVKNAPEQWRCIDAQWRCASGSRNSASGCACAGKNNACGWGATCENGQCMCGDTPFTGDAASYECAQNVVICGTSDGCPCGESLCGQGGICRNGACYCGDKTYIFTRGTHCDNGTVRRW